jgi:hypothetical protein
MTLPLETLVWPVAVAQNIAANIAASILMQNCLGRSESSFICETFLSNLKLLILLDARMRSSQNWLGIRSTRYLQS